MRFSYDREEDILMIEMAPGTIDHAEHTGPFIAHLDQNGQLLLLEILDASEFLSSLIRVALRHRQQEIPLVVG